MDNTQTTAESLLRRALEVLDEKVIGYEITKGAIRAYLAAKPEAEPVAYLFDADSYCDHAPIKDELVQSLPKGMLRQKIKNVRPLYTNPSPARKPMTEEELPNMGTPEYLTFVAGIRYAEKHHGIGGDDGEHK